MTAIVADVFVLLGWRQPQLVDLIDLVLVAVVLLLGSCHVLVGEQVPGRHLAAHAILELAFSGDPEDCYCSHLLSRADDPEHFIAVEAVLFSGFLGVVIGSFSGLDHCAGELICN